MPYLLGPPHPGRGKGLCSECPGQWVWRADRRCRYGGTLPVIGIPCKGPVLDGMDALLATVQMPTGIPVATVAINGGANAALLAAQILAVSDEDLARKLDEKRAKDAKKALEKDAALQQELNV